MAELRLDLEQFVGLEEEPRLGNGGLADRRRVLSIRWGRLAAQRSDTVSAASLGSSIQTG